MFLVPSMPFPSFSNRFQFVASHCQNPKKKTANKIRRKLQRMICSLLRCRCFRGRPHYQRVDDGSSGISFPFALISRPFSLRWAISLLFRLTVAISGLVMSFSLYHRTTNLWTLKNLGDTWMVKHIGRRPIVLGAFHRPSEEQNVPGHFAVLQFLGDGRQSHSLFCLSESADGQRKLLTRAHIERIHKGKRAANDLCSWSGHLAECEIVDEQVRTLRLTTEPNLLALPAPTEHSIEVRLEQPLRLEGRRKLPLAVCVAPMYTYTDWQIMLMGIETWMALGAQKMVFPIQSASSDTVFILREYERIGIVHIRMWPKWPLLSDVNPNGLTLSRGIEESHVNCLHFVKPFVDFAVFTDIDDMLMPLDPMKISPGINVAILQGLAQEHPNAGSFLFEHRDVQFAVPEMAPEAKKMLASFNFDFLRQTQWKTKCKVWRMKTRVVVNASRVDSVNMHETGIHRFGYVQVRVPCRVAHFYHLRHSYRNMALNEWPIDMANLRQTLNGQWANRLRANFSELAAQKPLAQSSVESFADFDHCMSAINEEHWGLRVSRCLTPHVCFSRLAKNISCISASGNYQFVHSSGDFVIALSEEASFGDSEPNCEAPLPKFVAGNHFYMP